MMYKYNLLLYELILPRVPDYNYHSDAMLSLLSEH